MIEYGTTGAIGDGKLRLKCMALLLEGLMYQHLFFFLFQHGSFFVLQADIAEFLCIIAMGGNIL